MQHQFPTRYCALLLASIAFHLAVLPLEAGTAPSTYSAYSGTDTKTIPPAPALGPANSVINDPTFGSAILRVTDQNTKGGESFISTDAGFHRAWNADSTAIKLTGPHGDGYWLEFNPSTFKVGDGSSQPSIHALPFAATWEWSTVNPDVIYFISSNQIGQYNKSTGSITYLGGPSNGDAVGYMAVVVGQDNWVCAAAGPGGQDTYTEIYCVNPANPSTREFINIPSKTINGVAQTDPNWPTPASGQAIGIHDIAGGTGPSWLEATFHGASWGSNGGSVFNLATNTWSLVTSADGYWSGHVSLGNGKYINSSGSINGRDSRGMVQRDANNLMNTSGYLFLEQPPDTLNNWCDADHTSWFNSTTNPNAPILDSRYTLSSNCAYAWTGEIVAAATDGSNTVWRFAHNHNGGLNCYYAESFAEISNDGNWALFSSYWDGNLGSDTAFGCSTRIDTFIVSLTGNNSGSGSGGTGSGASGGSGSGTGTSSGGGTAGTGTGSGGTGTGGGTTGSTGTGSGGTTTITTTRTEENGAGLTYTGNWYTNGYSQFSGGSAANSPDPTGQVTFTFTGVAVRWIGYADWWTGLANVSLDGQSQMVVDTSAPNAQFQKVQFSAAGLAQGTHTLVIQANGLQGPGSAIWVDAFDVDSASASGGTGGGTTGGGTTGGGSGSGTGSGGGTTTSGGSGGSGGSTPGAPYRVEQNDPSITYTGNWFNHGGAYYSGGGAVLAMDAGSSATVSFNGTGISWLGYEDQWSGIGQVYLDGQLAATEDTYTPNYAYQPVVYSVQNLNEGPHTLKIVVPQQKDSSSAGDWVWVDAFVITP